MRTEPLRREGNSTTLGGLAVAGVVVAASLSATLAKRAEAPGVLIAFWRLVIVSLVWSAYLRGTGRRLSMADIRQAFVPGVFFGLALAAFFAGATHNSVANTALILAMSPFLIVPLGARMFGDRLQPVALTFALLSFGGVVLVLFSAPSDGDATVEGNLFAALSMVCFVAYIVSTRYCRREMDVSTFMATISPIAAVAVLPLALAHGDMFAMSRTGWTYTVILALLNGVAAHGWNVYAQATIPIGTISVAQVAQPALAVVWAFLLLGEEVVTAQIVGIGVVTIGLLGFFALNERGARTT